MKKRIKVDVISDTRFLSEGITSSEDLIYPVAGSYVTTYELWLSESLGLIDNYRARRAFDREIGKSTHREAVVGPNVPDKYSMRHGDVSDTLVDRAVELLNRILPKYEFVADDGE